MTKPVNYVVDMDIEKFFDTVDHKWMTKCLRERIADPSLLRLIVRFLKAGIMEEGKYQETDEGTPQGGIISPVLANIYLHYILDLWFEKKIKKEYKGYAGLTRYADDFIICLESEEEAKAFGEKLRERLGKFGLKVSEEKSRVIEFGRKAWQKAKETESKTSTFNFLGFTHYCDKTRKGRFKVGRKTSGKKMKTKLKAMSQWLKGHPQRRRAKRVVEDAQTKADRPLSVLRHERKYERAEDISQPHREPCFQVDKQAESKEKYEHREISPLH